MSADDGKKAGPGVTISNLRVNRTSTELIFQRPPDFDDEGWRELSDTIMEAVSLGLKMIMFKGIADSLMGERPKPTTDSHAVRKTRDGEVLN